MNIKKCTYIVLILLILLSISTVSAADDAANDIISINDNEELILDETIDDDVSSANNNDQFILEENIGKVDVPLSNTISEEDSIVITDSASNNIQTNANENQAQNNNNVEEKDSSTKSILKDGESTNIYVSNAGSDTNNGLTPANSVATIAKAFEIVNNTGSSDFTVFVSNGSYDISQIVSRPSKNINLVGESKEETIIHVSGSYGIWICENNIKWNIRNLTFCDLNNTESTSAALRISVTNAETNISNCLFKNIGAGQGVMYIASSGKTTVSNVLIEDCFGTVTERSSIIGISGSGQVILDNVEIHGSYMLPPTLPWNTPYLGSIIYSESSDANASLLNSRITDNNGSIGSIIEFRGKIKVINTNITNNYLNSQTFGGNYLFYSGPSFNTASNINISQSLIADNVLATSGMSAGLFCSLYGNHNIDHNVIINNKFENGEDIPLGSFESGSSITTTDNYWGTNERPNNKTDRWVILTADVNDYAFVGVTEGIPIYLNTYMTTNGETGSVEGMATVDLGVTYVLNQENPSTVTIANGQGTIDYLATATGDETITLSTGDAFAFEVSDDISTLIYVDGSVETSGTGTSESPFKTIAEALNIAADGKIILIRNGTYKEKDLVIDKDITIKADKNAKPIIDAENGGRIFTVTSTATIRDLILTHGMSSNDGGAIYVDGGNLTAYNLKISNCSATNGGGIATTSTSKLTLSNSLFADNNATNGGAIYLASEAEIMMNDFTANSMATNGGAICINTTSSVIISANNFENNDALKGEGIYIKDALVNLSGNHMGTETIYLESGSINSKLVFLDGKTISCAPGDSIDLTATLTDDQGNIIKGGNLTFTANGETIGTVDLSGDNALTITYTVANDASSDIVISGSYSLDNEGTIVSGAIHPAVPHWFIEGSGGYETLYDAINAASSGDVIYGIPGTYTINDIFISKDITIKANETGSIILDGDKCRIFTITDSATLTLTGLDLMNGGNGWGGFIYIYASGGNLNLINSTLKDLRNNIQEYSGAAIRTLASSIINIEGCHFENINSSGESAIFSSDTSSRPTVTIKDSTFTKINCTNSFTLMNVGGNLRIERCNFTDIAGNVNKYQGGIGSDIASNYYISECQFINVIGGGGSAIYSRNSNITVTKSVFINNANTYGTIYLNNPVSANITYNLFIDNVPTSSNAKDIYIQSGNNVNASYNYFGSNSQPTNSEISQPDKASHWTVVDITCNNDPVYMGTTADITVKFMGTDGSETFALDEYMPSYSFDLSVSDGNINPVTVTIEDNEASARFNPPSMVGTVTLTATPGNAELEINVMDTSKLLVVSTEGNDENAGTLENPYASIAYALSQVTETRNIIYILDKGEAYKASNLTVSGNVIIMGENSNVTVSPEMESRIFTVTGNLVIKDLKLSNAYFDGTGGAIYLDGGNLTLNNVIISNCKADSGAAIASTPNSILNVTNTIFNNNNAVEGGAIYIAGEAIISNSTFNGNSGYDYDDHSYGGAIYINTTSQATISSNKFEDNKADKGEAIYIENGAVNLSKNTMPANETIYIEGGSISTILTFMDNSTIKAELGETINLNATLTDDNGNTIRGGTITFTANGETVGTLDLSDASEITLPYTVPNDAGADIIISGSYSFDNGGTVSNAKVHPTIPCWFIEGGNGYETLAEAIAAAQEGDVIYGIPGTYTINGIQILQSITIKANETGTIILDGNKSQMFRTGADISFINLTFVNGGSSGGGFISVNSGTVNLINSTLKDLKSSGQGAAITLTSGSNLNIEKSRFENISSSASAAVLTSTESNSAITIKDSSFDNINCTNDYTLMQIAGNLILERSNFTNIVGKYQSNWYGGIGLTGSANAFINECQFINITGGDGSAIYFNSNGKLNVTKSLFINNKNCRGTIYLGNPTSANINYNVFMDNECSGSNAKDIYKSTANAKLNADYNFWGTNSQPTASEITTISDVNYWTIVGLSSSTDTAYFGTSPKISAFFVGTNGEENFTLDNSMPECSFDLSASDGTLELTKANMKDNLATVTYTPPTVEGSVTITATPGPAELVLNIKDPSELLVVSTDGSDDNSGTLEHPYASIAYALSQVTETRNVIYLLNKGEDYEEHGLRISGNVVIRGEDNTVIINGGNVDRIFLITGNATIKDLTLTGGNANDYGGAIYVDGGILTLDNVIISRSNANCGGAIYINTTSDVSVTSSFFADNTAEKGDGIYIENCNIILSGNEMNGATLYLGGGSIKSKLVFLSNRTVNAEFGSTITLTASLTDDNGNIIRGGIVSFTINGETIATVDLSGDDELAINYTVPTDASEDILVSGSYNLDNEGIVATGAIHPCIFNWIIEGGEGYETLSEAIDAAVDGDVIYGIPGTYTISKLNINKAVTIKANESGTIILDGDGTQIFNVTSTVNLVNLTLTNGGTSGNGGLIYVERGSLTANNIVFRDTNMSTSYTRGGAIYSIGSLYIYDSVFEGLQARQGAAIYEQSSSGILIIENTVFNNINSTYDGGLMYSNVVTSIKKSNFTNIIGVNTTGEYGNIYAIGDKLSIEECNFINIFGPGGAAVYYSKGSGVLNITKSIFENVNCTNKGIIFSTAETHINYNVFLDVNEGVNISSSNSNSVNIDYNYWGTNENPSYIMPTYSPNNWIIMNVALNDTSTVGQKDVTVIVDFNHYIENGEIHELEDSLTREFTVNFSSINGEFDVGEVNTTDQVATTTYTVAIGENSITVKSYDSFAEIIFDGLEPLNSSMSLEMDGEKNLIVTITDEDGNGLEGKTIELLIGDKTLYGTTDAEGKATISLDEVEDGAYTSTVIFKDPIYKNIEESTFVIIKSNEVPVDSNSRFVISSSGDSINITLLDGDGNAIANAIVNAIINGIESNLTTDTNGYINIPISGNATVNLSYTDSNGAKLLYTTKIISNKIATKIKYNKMTTITVYPADGKIGKYFKISLVDANGKALANKVVKIGLNGVTYNCKTNKNGVAQLQINLKKKGTYFLAICFLGDKNYNASFAVSKVIVKCQKPKLTARAKKYKAKAKRKSLTATLKTAHGKAIKGKRIFFKIKGKTYKGTTNAKGVATVKVKLSKKGTYTCRVQYKGDNTFKKVNKKFKVKIV